eukprot:TRINITY_DN1444_c0_g5_i1.p1 TRINITY_DN1444_c0_g5~~TRINITY_DN1444_c0_g5_i1.p1  ORF type:complete len:206 (-),score=46.42 TRINITY_DN1444_c0_g5_i1:15-632(-)
MASLEIEEGIKIVSNPFELFNDWYKKAKPHPDILTPDAFCFATSSSGGLPSCRMVLMRRFSESGLSLSTGSLSRKGKDLKENPFASCCFYWEPLYQQVIIQGRVEPDPGLSDELWEGIPTDLQYSVAAMTQGEEFGERQYFLEKRKEIVMKYSDKPVPRPVDQIAYTLRPTMFGFYQSNSMRTTDRIEYKWDEEKKEWSVTRVGI